MFFALSPPVKTIETVTLLQYFPAVSKCLCYQIWTIQDTQLHTSVYILAYLRILRLFVFATLRLRLLSVSPMLPFLHWETKQVHLFVCFPPINNNKTNNQASILIKKKKKKKEKDKRDFNIRTMMQCGISGLGFNHHQQGQHSKYDSGRHSLGAMHLMPVDFCSSFPRDFQVMGRVCKLPLSYFEV